MNITNATAAEWSGRGELEAVEAFIEAVRPAGEPGVLPSRLFRDLEVSSKRERKWGAAPTFDYSSLSFDTRWSSNL